MKKVIAIVAVLLTVICLLCLTGCSTVKISSWFNSSNHEEKTNNKENEKEKENTKMKYEDVEKNPVVTMEMENGGIVKIELYPKIAPQTVENFISLIKNNFYNGLTFHRVIPSFVAQGGDPKGDGTGGPGYSIQGEFSANGFENSLHHEVGVISMARSEAYDSAGSQFFIVTDENAYLSLDENYAGFGKVIEGMDIVNDIVNSEVIRTDYSEELYKEIQAAGNQITTVELYEKYIKEVKEIDRPVNPPVIKSMTVDTFGYEYKEPHKIITENM